MKFYQRLLALLLIAAALLPVSAGAAEKNAITVQHVRDGLPIVGAQFQIYKVSSGHKTAQDAYAAVLQAGQKPQATAQTNSRGQLRFSGLADGTYLLTGTPHKIGSEICEPEMSLLTLPGKDVNGKPVNVIIVQPKFEIRDENEPIEYRVIVLWETVPGAKDKKHPDSVQVHLYRNGSRTETLQLGTANSWQSGWTETDPMAVWAVAENLPEGYTVRYERQGNTFIIINTPVVEKPKETQPAQTTPDDSKLPQTGQLWWPVPVLAMSGFTLLLLGWLRRKESRDEA